MSPQAEDIRRRAEHLAAGLPQLLVAAERIAVTVAPGTHGRRRVGQGETFWQFRRYQSGDPASVIDWRQSAKSQPLYVRETEWEAAQSIWLWRDSSPSMRYRSGKALPEKREHADLLLLALAILLVRAGENVAMLGSGRAPAHGSTAVDRITIELVRGVAGGRATQRASASRAPPGGLPEFEILRRHGHVVMIGDFLEPLEDIEARFQRFAARRVKGHIVQILDPAEVELPFTGRTRFEGLEREGDVLVRRVEEARPEYLSRLEAQREGLRRMTRELDWTYTSHRTDRPAQAALRAIFTVLCGALGK